MGVDGGVGGDGEEWEGMGVDGGVGEDSGE